MADPQHLIPRVGPPLRPRPFPQLMGKIGRGLPGEGRKSRTEPLSPGAVTRGAGFDSPPWIANVKEPRCRPRGISRLDERHGRIIVGDQLPIPRVQLFGDPAHLRVRSAAVRVSLELAHQIAGIERRQPRRSSAIALTLQSMAGEAGILRTRAPAAERNHLAAPRKAIDRLCVDPRACSQGKCGGNESYLHDGHRLSGTGMLSARFRRDMQSRHSLALVALAAIGLTVGCKPPPAGNQFMPLASAERGRQAIKRAGCGSCHTIAGIDWPQGRAAPELGGFARRALIAGQLPNSPDRLAAFVRNAPAVAPGTTMPAMPLSQQDARDVAAYLYEIEG